MLSDMQKKASSSEWPKKNVSGTGLMSRATSGKKSILVAESIFETGWSSAKNWERFLWKRSIPPDTNALNKVVKNFTESG